ncbi:MAG: hypothetical protein ACM3ML_16170 [Micromonosporaceae bacterium]
MRRTKALARVSLRGGAGTCGFLMAAMGIGAVAGGLVVATRACTGLLPFTAAACAFGVAILGAALVPSIAAETAALTIVGGAMACLAAAALGAAALARLPPAERRSEHPREMDWKTYQQTHET